MEEMKNEEMTKEPEATEPEAKRRRTAEGESESGILRLKLSGALGTRVRETVVELKGRGVNVTAEEVMADYLERIPGRYFEGQILKRTPERFYIETAIGLPEVREKLIRQAKRSLEKFAGTKATPSSTVRRRKAGEPASGAASSAESEG